GGVIGGHEIFQDAGAAGRRNSSRAQHVLDGDRNAGQGAEGTALLPIAIDGLGLAQGVVLQESAKRLHPGLDLAGAPQPGAADLGRARLSGSDERADLPDRAPVRDTHPITLGTLKRPCSDSGALASASSRDIDGRSVSSRRACEPTSTCDVGWMSAVSSAFRRATYSTMELNCWVKRPSSSSENSRCASFAM